MYITLPPPTQSLLSISAKLACFQSRSKLGRVSKVFFPRKSSRNAGVRFFLHIRWIFCHQPNELKRRACTVPVKKTKSIFNVIFELSRCAVAFHRRWVAILPLYSKAHRTNTKLDGGFLWKCRTGSRHSADQAPANIVLCCHVVRGLQITTPASRNNFKK